MENLNSIKKETMGVINKMIPSESKIDCLEK